MLRAVPFDPSPGWCPDPAALTEAAPDVVAGAESTVPAAAGEHVIVSHDTGQVVARLPVEVTP